MKYFNENIFSSTHQAAHLSYHNPLGNCLCLLWPSAFRHAVSDFREITFRSLVSTNNIVGSLCPALRAVLLWYSTHALHPSCSNNKLTQEELGTKSLMFFVTPHLLIFWRNYNNPSVLRRWAFHKLVCVCVRWFAQTQVWPSSFSAL